MTTLGTSQIGLPEGLTYEEKVKWYNARSYAKRRKEWFAFIAELKSGPCTDCGQTFHPAAMQFDHIEGERLHDVSSLWGRTREVVLAELEKCVLRCANCHAIRHYRHAYEVQS